MRATPHRKEAWTWAESIITSAKRIVKSEGVDENSGGGFSQKATETLGGEYHHFSKKNCKIQRGG